MMLIFVRHTSARLHYVLSFLFKELMGVEYRVVSDEAEFNNDKGIRINYDGLEKVPGALSIYNCGLLNENGIRPQNIQWFTHHGYRAFFKGDSEEVPFDLFSASFFLISRYEEYLSHTRDSYGRYAHENAIAFKEQVLNLPLINIWVKDLAAVIGRKFSVALQPGKVFEFIPTYDIDIAYSFKHKGFLRNLGGLLKSPSWKRIRVLSGLEADPFDTYDWLSQLHLKYELKPLFFFLVAQKNAGYDKNILPHKKAVKSLIRFHAGKYSIGIHPSWQSGDNFLLMKKEKKLLQEIADTPIHCSRQHYIRFDLPHGYRRLIEAGITDDYSMGYGSINGFRASVASSFYWYDLENEKQTNLRVHPFCFMEANSFYEQHYTSTQAFEELMHYYNVCRDVNSSLISIWHNHFFGTDPLFAGWKEVYEKFIVQVQ